MTKGTDAKARLATLVLQCERDHAAIASVRDEADALAAKVGGDLELRWRIAVVRACMSDPPDGDAVRELYGELVDRYRDQPEQLAALRALGDDIRRMEADGTLPSTLVARSDRRPRR